MATLRRAHPAMNTLFEAILEGDDAEHLDAVASAIFDEIDRIERRLSRFDPRSEISRINREASARPVRIDEEMLSILLDCESARVASRGAFDACPGHLGTVEVDPIARTVQFTRENVAIDLGGYGKGYALDQATIMAKAQGIESALLHGGTSSVRSIGPRAWPIGVRDPFRPPEDAPELFRVALADRGFSCSAVFGHNQRVSDLIDPRRGRPLTEPAACVVVAGTAAKAEVWSTALLCLGRIEAARLAIEHHLEIAWIEPGDAGPTWAWLHPNRERTEP